MSTESPLFPLKTVLFPGGVLPLRIFESRYLDMVKRCMRTGSEFGVVLITEGFEAGTSVSIREIGTMARVVDFDTLPDGLLGVTALGQLRFKVTSRRVMPDGLNVADVESLAAEPIHAVPDEYVRYAKLLEQALPQMGAYFRHLQPNYSDAAWVSHRLAELLPIPLELKQRLLEMNDPLKRLGELEPLIRDAVPLDERRSN